MIIIMIVDRFENSKLKRVYFEALAIAGGVFRYIDRVFQCSFKKYREGGYKTKQVRGIQGALYT